MARKGSFKKAKGINAHHLLPTSRGGSDWGNIVFLPVEWHRNLHKLFGVLTPDEMHRFIDIVLQPNTRWTQGDIERLRSALMRGEV